MQNPLIVAGCYERFLFGFVAPTQSASSSQEPLTLEKKHTFAAHKNAVKCVAGARQFLASGGADDTIHLYDIQHDKDLGFLMNPGDGAIPCLKFFTPSAASAASHMFSGSADGSISIWKAGGGWEHLKTMRGHKSSVNDLAVHHSGRLALSVGRDSSIRMWDLLKGRASYTAQLELEGDIVAFLPGGESYVLVCGTQVTVHSTSGEGGVLATLTHSRRVQCMAQTNDDVLLTGSEDGAVKVWDLRSSSCSHSMERAHTSRVRGLAVLREGAEKVPELFTTASSDGMIKVWDSRMLSSGGGGGSACLAAGATNARITCLCVVQPVPPKVKGAKQAKAKVEKPAEVVEPAAQAKVMVEKVAEKGEPAATKPAAGKASKHKAGPGKAVKAEPAAASRPAGPRAMPKAAQAALKPKKLISKAKGTVAGKKKVRVAGGLAAGAGAGAGVSQGKVQGLKARPKPPVSKGGAAARVKRK